MHSIKNLVSRYKNFNRITSAYGRQAKGKMNSKNKVEHRERLSIKEKYDLLKDHEKKIPIAQLVKKYKCSKTLIYECLKKKATIVEQFFTAQNTDVKNKQRTAKFELINNKTFEWLTQVLAKNLPINGVLVQEQAKKIAIENSVPDFKASNGWLESFKIRHNLTFSAISGESKDVDVDIVNTFREKLPELIEGYDPKDIANCDETALFFRAIPRKTLHRKGDKCFGGKHSKERITVLLCCFADGSFEKPMVIGKTEKPRCFKNIQKENLPVIWRSNKKAWNTASIMEDWLIQLNKKMKIQNRKILLTMDNATCHPNLRLSNVELLFFPPNTTSHTQPLDSGIINAIKAKYRVRVLRKLLSQMNSAENIADMVKSITVLDAIYWLSSSVHELATSVVPNCFRKAGFTINSSEDVPMDEEDLPLSVLRDLMSQANCDDLTVEEFVQFDNNVITENDIDFRTAMPPESNNEDSDNDYNDIEEDNSRPKTHPEAIQLLNQLKAYACEKGLEPLLNNTIESITYLENDFSNKKNKQSHISDYFSKSH